MKKLFALAALTLFAAPNAFAHLETGTYVGKTADAKACSMEVVKVYFENGAAHPLNERALIRIDGQEFVVGHVPVVDAAESIASFDHNLFQAGGPRAGRRDGARTEFRRPALVQRDRSRLGQRRASADEVPGSAPARLISDNSHSRAILNSRGQRNANV
jgi:hypothetical protein